MNRFIFALLVSAAFTSPAWAEDDNDADVSGGSGALRGLHQASQSSKDLSDAVSNLSDTVSKIRGGGDDSGGESDDAASDTSSRVQDALQSLTNQDNGSDQGGGDAQGAPEGNEPGREAEHRRFEEEREREHMAHREHEYERVREEREHREHEREHWAHREYEHRQMGAQEHRQFGGERPGAERPGFFQRMGNSMNQSFHAAGQKFQNMRANHMQNGQMRSQPMIAHRPGMGTPPRGVVGHAGKPVQVAKKP